MSIFPKFFFTLFGNAPKLPDWLRSYIARVEEDGGTIVDTGHTEEVYSDVQAYNPTLIQSCDSGKATVAYSLLVNPQALLETFTGSAAAYSLRSLSASTTNVVKVRRDSDDAELDFTASDISNGTLTSWVNTDVQVMANPDITSATGWVLSSYTTYNASTEAFDLVNENGLTVRQGEAIAGLTYDITLVVDSVALSGIRVYVGGTQSADITSAGTYNITITAGSSNSFIGINPIGSATCSISSFYATQTTANGLVSTWYDQSGNANNATQATAANQPKIVSTGTLVTENGKAALDFDGSDDFLSSANFQSFTATESYGFVAFKPLVSGTVRRIVDHDKFLIQSYSTASQYNGSFVYDIGGSFKGSGVVANLSQVQQIMSGGYDGIDIETYINGILRGSLAISGNIISTSDNFEISSSINPYEYSGTIQEVIIYASDQSANRTGIEANINDYYNIYP